MKWRWQKGVRNFEECVDVAIDFENRRFTVEYYYNHPMGGGGNSETFAFEDAASEKFRGLIEYYGDENFDKTFGAGAGAEFSRILKMSKAEYDAESLENREVMIDLTVNQ
jgi:hypothetical protein